MGRISIAAYRPKPGKEDEFQQIVRDHLPVLRSQALATGRAPIVCKAQDGTIVEVFEWVSDEAIEQAHSNPVVHQLWARYEQACDYVSLPQLDECKSLFATFESVEA